MGLLKANKWKLTAVIMLMAVCFSSYGLLSTSHGALCPAPCEVPEFYESGEVDGCSPDCKYKPTDDPYCDRELEPNCNSNLKCECGPGDCTKNDMCLECKNGQCEPNSGLCNQCKGCTAEGECVSMDSECDNCCGCEGFGSSCREGPDSECSGEAAPGISKVCCNSGGTNPGSEDCNCESPFP